MWIGLPKKSKLLPVAKDLLCDEWDPDNQEEIQALDHVIGLSRTHPNIVNGVTGVVSVCVSQATGSRRHWLFQSGYM
jgi:hypothetical protein